MQHHSDWKIECRNLAVLLLVAALLGWLFNQLAWALCLASIGYSGWNLIQLQRIQKWLAQHSELDPPEAKGLWGEVLDGIYRLQRQAKEEHSRLQATVDYLQDSFASLDDGAVMINQRGNIEWSNRAAEKLLGLRYPDDSKQQLVNLIRNPEFVRYFEGDDYADCLQMASPYNAHYQLQINISYFGRGSRLLFARDITQTHRLQQMRTDFVANVSHELRTPITVINGYLETLMDHDEVDEAIWKRAVQQMLTQSHRMESLIKDLIILSRLESVPESTEQGHIKICPMLEMIREEVLAAIKGPRHITVDCDSRLELIGDSGELHSAFNNLVMNAAKYTGDNGEITVRWYADKTFAYLQVEDNGDGIESHHLPRLTERFYRVDQSRSIDTGGTGLGLAIVKHILLRYNAELQISSTLGEGSCFSCVFPLSRTVSS